MRGRFVVLEGMDGTGKTTQALRLMDHWRATGRRPVHLREPGATRVGELLRSWLLDPERPPCDPRTEALLFFAARNELLRSEVAPALEDGRDVLCERFTASTLAYQAQDPEMVEFVLALDELVVPSGWQPDLVVIFDLDPEEAFHRAHGRDVPDAFEKRGVAFQEKVRAGYLRYAEARAKRTRVLAVDGLDADGVEEKLRACLEGWTWTA